MANSVRWYCHVLRREDSHVLRIALDFEVDGQWEAEEDMVKTGGGRKCEDWFEKGRCTLLIKVECWC